MKIYKYPKREQWAEITSRPRLDLTKLNETVATVLADIRQRGDAAVREYELKFDKAELGNLAVTEQEMDEAEKLVSNELRDAIILAHHNIKVFHISQRFVGQKVKTQEGVTCWQKSVGIERVGLYIPGGTAPLFSTVLMLATPAKIAGCKEIVLCTPPNREGKVNPAILVAARIAGVSKIFKIGGVQAIGAMAYGTESVPKVFKIFGPGNQYVMAAKQHVSLDEVAIDMPAGPSEVCVLADGLPAPVRSAYWPTRPPMQNSLLPTSFRRPNTASTHRYCSSRHRKQNSARYRQKLTVNWHYYPVRKLPSRPSTTAVLCSSIPSTRCWNSPTSTPPNTSSCK